MRPINLSTILGQDKNYPNPFNEITNIVFYLPYNSIVTLNIYNIHGILIKTISLGYNSIGVQKVRFDGFQLASGIYFYQLISNGISNVKKMILLK
jgi:hypothetical protein